MRRRLTDEFDCRGIEEIYTRCELEKYPHDLTTSPNWALTPLEQVMIGGSIAGIFYKPNRPLALLTGYDIDTINRHRSGQTKKLTLENGPEDFWFLRANLNFLTCEEVEQNEPIMSFQILAIINLDGAEIACPDNLLERITYKLEHIRRDLFMKSIC